MEQQAQIIVMLLGAGVNVLALGSVFFRAGRVTQKLEALDKSVHNGVHKRISSVDEKMDAMGKTLQSHGEQLAGIQATCRIRKQEGGNCET